MKRLYVLVNKKLAPIYGCVQGGHAVAQFMLENPKQEWNNDFLIYLYADTDKWFDKLRKQGVKFSVFREPDLNNTITAIAVQNDDGELFKSLQLKEAGNSMMKNDYGQYLLSIANNTLSV